MEIFMKRIIVSAITLISLNIYGAQDSDVAQLGRHTPGFGSYIIDNPDYLPLLHFLNNRYHRMHDRKIEKKGDIECVVITPDNNKLIIAYSTYDFWRNYISWIEVSDFNTGMCLKTFKLKDTIHSLVVSANSKYCIARTGHEVFILNLVTNNIEHILRDHNGEIQSLAITPDSTCCVISANLEGGDQTVRIWDIATGRYIHEANNEYLWPSDLP
jgi:WD40 repeat protein